MNTACGVLVLELTGLVRIEISNYNLETNIFKLDIIILLIFTRETIMAFGIAQNVFFFALASARFTTSFAIAPEESLTSAHGVFFCSCTKTNFFIFITGEN